MQSNAGKSRFITNIIAYLVYVEKKKVLLISNEMTEDKMKLCLITTIVNNPEIQGLHGQKLHKKEAQDFSKMKEKIKRERKDSERIKKAENKKECEKAKRILLLEKYIGEKMDVEDLRVLIRSLGFKKDKKGNIYKKLEDVIRFINELGYNIEYHEDKKYCWTHKYYLIIKI